MPARARGGWSGQHRIAIARRGRRRRRQSEFGGGSEIVAVGLPFTEVPFSV
jgi:hypothetical protein